MEKYQINSVLLAQAWPAMVNHLSSTPSEVYPTHLVPSLIFLSRCILQLEFKAFLCMYIVLCM